MKHRFIVIEGNIGAGKTSLARRIADQFNGALFLEKFEENPYLKKFYKNPEKYSLMLELSFLTDRFKQSETFFSNGHAKSELIVADYYFNKSLIFASSTLNEEENMVYSDVYNLLYKSLPKPDLYVYLHQETSFLLENIKKRGRDYEKSIGAEYLFSIQNSYLNFLEKEKELKILLIHTKNIDFVNNNNDYKKILDAINCSDYKSGVNRISL